MSLAKGILGFLAYGDMSGYDLAKAFDSSVRFFWHAQKAQIYQTLDRLERQGLVTYERVVQDGRPNKKLYAITDEGRAEFLTWLAHGAGDVDFKSTLLMKLFFSGNLTSDQTIEHLREFIDDCEAYSADMQQIPQSIEFYGPLVPDANPPYWELVADFGARYMRMCVEWAQDSIERLEDLR